jgi:hypothetical protein
MSEEFIAYVGSWEIHDAVIQRIENAQQTVTVFLKAYDGRDFAVRCYGVARQEAHNPEGIMLYALSEMSCPAPLRKFVFVNWDEENPARLEIVAESLEILDTLPNAAKD